METHDPWGRRIVLAEGCWIHHVLARRPALHGRLDAVERAIREPLRVTLDAVHAHRECFYGREFPIEHVDVILKVVVEFTPDSDFAVGEVVTVIPMSPDRDKKGERPKWP